MQTLNAVPAPGGRHHEGPGRGLTRSFVHLAHGDWLAAWRCHRLGWLLALAVLLQLPYRVLALRRADKPLLGPSGCRRIAWLLVFLLIGNWLFDLVLGSL